MFHSLGGILSIILGRRAKPHKDSASIPRYICYKWVIYLSGKVSYRTWRNLLNKKIDDSHNFIIPLVSTREETHQL